MVSLTLPDLTPGVCFPKNTTVTWADEIQQYSREYEVIEENGAWSWELVSVTSLHKKDKKWTSVFG